MIAVSGIDYTVKIFSADAKERKRAVLGKSIQAKKKDRALTRLVDGFLSLGVLDNEDDGYGWEDVFAGTGKSKGLASRRRKIDLDKPRRQFHLASLDDDDDGGEGGGEEYI
jgi:hypothetical protein